MKIVWEPAQRCDRWPMVCEHGTRINLCLEHSHSSANGSRDHAVSQLQSLHGMKCVDVASIRFIFIFIFIDCGFSLALYLFEFECCAWTLCIWWLRRIICFVLFGCESGHWALGMADLINPFAHRTQIGRDWVARARSLTPSSIRSFAGCANEDGKK